MRNHRFIPLPLYTLREVEYVCYTDCLIKCVFTLHVYTLDVSACGAIVGHFDDIRLGAECSLFKPYSLAPLNPYSYAHTFFGNEIMVSR